MAYSKPVNLSSEAIGAGWDVNPNRKIRGPTDRFCVDCGFVVRGQSKDLPGIFCFCQACGFSNKEGTNRKRRFKTAEREKEKLELKRLRAEQEEFEDLKAKYQKLVEQTEELHFAKIASQLEKEACSQEDSSKEEASSQEDKGSLNTPMEKQHNMDVDAEEDKFLADDSV